MSADPIAQFRDALVRTGLPAPEHIDADGALHRFATNGRTSDDSGWYVLHLDGIAAGAFGDWRSGVSETWRADIGRSLTLDEERAHRERVARMRADREAVEAERARLAAERAAELWRAAQPAPADHPYLSRKGVQPHGLRVQRGSLVIGGIDCDGALVLPLRDTSGALHSVEFIIAGGEKRYLPGGRIAGCYFAVGQPDGVLVIAEGYATAASVHAATGFAAACATSAGNLLPVASALREKFPQARIIVAADNDASGTGERAALDAASAVGAVVAMPIEAGTDWNDVLLMQGATAVRTGIASASSLRGDSASAYIAGAALLDDVSAFLSRFVAYPSDHARIAHTLWIAHTHLMDAWESTPRIAFLSPEPGSGKTRALEISELLVPRPIEAINATPAYLFRKVSDPDGLPTILFDEIDTLFGAKAKEHEEIRGILNAGHRRGAKAGRCVVVGKTVKTEELPAYCAVALAGLGNLPDTILTRSVVVRMRRRAPTETVEPYRRRVHGDAGHALRDRLATWAADVAASIVGTYPTLPQGIEDRAADVWEPLLAVAEACGGDWPTRARVAAVALVAAARESPPSLGVRLLADLRVVFGDRPMMTTMNIIEMLIALDEAPWADLRGQPIDPRKLANYLRPYGVESTKIRVGTATVRGYKREDLHDAWTRYLPPVAPAASGTSGTDGTARTDGGPDVADAAPGTWNTRNASGTERPGNCSDVPDVPDVPHPSGPTGADAEVI